MTTFKEWWRSYQFAAPISRQVAEDAFNCALLQSASLPEGRHFWCSSWDLSTIPEEAFASERARRHQAQRKTKSGGTNGGQPKKVLDICGRC